MATKHFNTLQNYNPLDNTKNQQIVRKHEENHAKSDFFDIAELIFVWLFLFGFCIVMWIAFFRALGA